MIKPTQENNVVTYRRDEMPKLMTSEEWLEHLQLGAYVVEPEGWDMDNFEQSWFKEPISKQTFEMRFFQSKVHFPDFTKDIWE
jgi:hypothetical protein